uniref:Protein phosphatase n=1 Tax=Albugo laibachii Nc14 TaxID=890382 RepID=F0WWW6_9STRA|nr:hypothetical protein SELMODRAFT_101879 [Albugo laibachii Nc14]|eukprot:CCA25951.1 hypothetical protein SELMODRAFT_101879 [Albugo laibachii Nc14]
MHYEGSLLRAVNLGDSGFIVCRRKSQNANLARNMRQCWEVVYESKHQSHFFNCPYQLGHLNGDSPEISDQIEYSVQAEDVIILGTDGLFDNLYPSQIAIILDHLGPNFLYEPQLVEEAANNIAHEAHQTSKCKQGSTPFAIAARKAGYKYDGGKMDDITVIISMVAKSVLP